MIARQETFNAKDEVWSALAAPVPAGTISWRQDGKPVTRDGRQFARFVCYIEANTVRERLDTVVPGEWDLTLEMLPQLHGSDDADSVCAFKARLQVLGVIREDVGTGRDYKQASTDAFKRAAVRFGIGNELYSYEQNWVEVDGDGKYAKPVEDPAQAYERRHGSGAGKLTRAAVATEASFGASEPNTLTDVDSVSCPKCGGRTWDNRLTKRNPKAPDYKCRDRNCDGVVWPARANGTPGEASDSHEGSDEAVAVAEAPARKTRASKLALTDEIPF
jgi:Rad52/22 family double-strand break repair protein